MKYLSADHVMTMLERRFARDSSSSLHQQLNDLVRQLVIDGELPVGARLPSTRVMAERLALSRHTVYAAIEQLSGEGYLVGMRGSGTYVSHHFALDRPGLRTPKIRSTVADISSRGRSLVEMQRSPFQWDDLSGVSSPPPFRVGLPAIDAFPHREWARALNRAWLSNIGHLGYQQPGGHRALREAICSYLHASRGLRCQPGQIVVTAGSQNGLDLALRLLIDPGELVALEDPGYLGARSAALAAGRSSDRRAGRRAGPRHARFGVTRP